MISIVDKYEGSSRQSYSMDYEAGEFIRPDRSRPFFQTPDPVGGASGGSSGGSSGSAADNRPVGNKSGDAGGPVRPQNSSPARTILLTAVVLVIAALLFGGGYTLGRKQAPVSTDDLQTSFYAKIISVDNNTIHVTGIPENDINHRGEAFLSFKDPTDAAAITDEQGNPLSRTVLEPEQMIRVWYSGPVLESYPVQINGVTRIIVLDEQAQADG